MGVFGILRGGITALLVVGCLFVGANKLTDKVDPNMYAKIQNGAQAYEAIWHHQELAGLNSQQFVFFIGVVEALGGIGLLIPGFLGSLASFGLFVTFLCAAATDYLLERPIVPPLIFVGLLLIRTGLGLMNSPAARSNKQKKN